MPSAALSFQSVNLEVFLVAQTRLASSVAKVIRFGLSSMIAVLVNYCFLLRGCRGICRTIGFEN